MPPKIPKVTDDHCLITSYVAAVYKAWAAFEEPQAPNICVQKPDQRPARKINDKSFKGYVAGRRVSGKQVFDLKRLVEALLGFLFGIDLMFGKPMFPAFGERVVQIGFIKISEISFNIGFHLAVTNALEACAP